MITTETRRDSYNRVLETLSKRQQIIIKKFSEAPNAKYTARELAVELHKDGVIITNDRNMVQPRLTELVGKGIIQVVGKKFDETMGRHVAYYQLAEEE